MDMDRVRKIKPRGISDSERRIPAGSLNFPAPRLQRTTRSLQTRRSLVPAASLEPPRVPTSPTGKPRGPAAFPVHCDPTRRLRPATVSDCQGLGSFPGAGDRPGLGPGAAPRPHQHHGDRRGSRESARRGNPFPRGSGLENSRVVSELMFRCRRTRSRPRRPLNAVPPCPGQGTPGTTLARTRQPSGYPGAPRGK